MPSIGDVRDSYTVQVSLQDDVSLQANKVSNAFDAMAQSAGRAVDANEAMADATGASSRAQADFNSVLSDWSQKSATAPQQLANIAANWDAMAASTQASTQQLTTYNAAMADTTEVHAQTTQQVGQVKDAFGGLKGQLVDAAVTGGLLAKTGRDIRTGFGELGQGLYQVTQLLGTSTTAQQAASGAQAGTTQAMNSAAQATRGAAEASSGLSGALNSGKESIASAGSVLSGLAAAANASQGSLGAFIARLAPIGFTVGGITGIVVGAAGGLAAMGKAAIDAQEAYDRLAHSLQATRDDWGSIASQIEATAKAIAETTPASAEAARRVASTIASQPNFSGSMDLTDLTNTAENIAAATGRSFEAAGQRIAGALKDTAQAARLAAEQGIKGFDDQLVDTIDLMQRSGDRAQAFTTYLNTIKAASAGAAGEVSPLKQALKDLGETLDPAHGGFGATSASFLKNMEDGFARMIEKANTYIQKAQELGRSYFPNVFGDNTPSAVTQAPGFNAMAPLTSVPVNQNVTQQNLELINQAFATLAAKVPAASKDGLYGFTSQVLQNESTGQMTDFRGNILRSSAGSLGLMQLQPGTGAQYAGGQNYLTPQGNVTTGLAFILHLNEKYAGDLVKMAIAYNWGEGNADSFFGGFKAGLPSETIGFVQKTTGVNAAQLQQRFGDVMGQGQFRQQIYNDANKITGSGDTAGQMRDNLAQQQILEKAIAQSRADADKALASGDSDAWVKAIRNISEYHDKLDAVTGAYTQIRTESQKAADAAVKDADKTAAHVKDAEEKVYELKVQLQEIAEKTGKPFDQASFDRGAAAIRRQDTEEDIQKQTDLADAYEKTTTQLQRANELGHAAAAANLELGDAVQKAVNAVTAENEAEKAGIEPGERRNKLIQDRIAALNQRDRQKIDEAAMQDTRDFQAQNAMLQDQIALLGKDTKTQAELVAEMTERHKWHLTLTDDLDEEQRAAVNAAKANADLKTSFEEQKQSLQALGQIFKSAFDTIATSITDAFIKGKGAAVDFGNVAKAVAVQAAKAFLELAIINPVANSLHLSSTTQPTFGTAFQALNNLVGSSGDGSGGSLLSNLSSLSSISSIGSKAYNFLTSGSLFGASTTASIDALGASLFGLSGGAVGSMGATNAAIAAMGGGAFGPAAPGAVAAMSGIGPTLSGLIGGVGLGFAGGSLAGGFLQSSLGKTGPAPMIGAGTGAIAGAVIGSFVPVVGTIIGGIIGGLIGGGGGGFIGPHRASPFSQTNLQLDQNGMLQTGVSFAQGYGSNLASTIQDATTLNSFLSAQGVRLSSTGLLHQVGMGGQLSAANPGGFWDSGKFQDLASGFSQLRFTSSDSILSDKLSNKPFSNFTDFQTYIANFKAAQTAVVAMLTNVSTTLGALDKTTGSYNDAVSALNANYTANKTAADALLASGMLSAAQVTKLTAAETDLATIRDHGVEAARKAAEGILNTAADGYQARYLNARATRTGTIADSQTSQLFAFDTQATAERKALSDQIIAIYGDGIKNTQGYNWRMGQLEKALGEERLAIVESYAQKIVDQEASMASYNKSLTSRYLNAQATISGSPGDQLTAQLYGFDAQAQGERDALSKQLVAFYGSSYKTSAAYYAQMAQLEKTLGAERVAIQTAANEKVAQTATASVTSLSNYVAKLATGSQAPLSPQSQYSMASSQFNAVVGSARAGNWQSYQSITGYADSLLAASSSMYGSGTAYIEDFKRVLDALTSLTSISPDDLTAAIYRSETRSQTQQLVDSLAEVRAEIASLRQQIALGSAAPIRVAA